VHDCVSLSGECLSLPVLATSQKNERSAADSTRFKSGSAQYAFIKENYIDQNKTPKFASQTDYVIWKRMNTINHITK
jgi:hypothetical protein